MITQEMHEKVLNWAIDTLAKLGVTDHPVDIQWNDRFTSRMGDALYREQGSRIRFSRPLWPRASEQDRYETVVHEVCHIVARHRNRGRRISPHGWEWQRAMLECGVEPKRCHNVDREGLGRTSSRRTVRAWCDCDEHNITPYRADQIRGRTHGISCRACGVDLRLQEKHLTFAEALELEYGAGESAPAAHAPAARTNPNDSEQKGLNFVMKNGRAFMRFV